MPIGLHTPLIVDIAARKHQNIGAVALVFLHRAIQQHRVFIKVIALPHPSTHALGTGFVVVEPCLQGGGDEIGGIDAVLAGKAVFTEQLLVSETVFRGIKQGQIVLAALRNVGVKQARLQGLN